MFEEREVFYAVFSEEDNRFDFNGSYMGFVTDGVPDCVTNKIKELEKMYDCEAPDDLMFNCMKE